MTELEKNFGLHDDIQAYLQLERDGNWYAYHSGVAKTAIFKYATYNHTSRRLKLLTSSVRIHGYYGHSKSTLTSIANEVEAERGLGNAKLIPSPIANVFWEGDRYRCDTPTAPETGHGDRGGEG